MNLRNLTMNYEIDGSDFACMIICSVRYATGRMTYVVHEVADIVRKHMKDLRDDTLIILDRDIRRELERGNYGMECDLRIWNGLLDEIDKERKARAAI